MTQADQQFYEDLFSMFTSPGWKHVIEGLEKELARINKAEGIPDEATLKYAQGQIHVIRDLLNFEEGANLAYQQMIEQAQENDAEDI